MGNTRLLEKKVEWERCALASPEDLAKANADATSARAVKPFCQTQKGATCEVIKSDSESGVFRGAAYNLYSDSASVVAVPGGDITDVLHTPRWRIGCSREKMTAQRTCSVSQGDVAVFFRASAVTIVVGQDHFPGSVTSLKIGTRRFDTSQQDGNFAASKEMVQMMADGQQLVTRYMKWPDRHWVEDEFNTSGFQASATLARWLLKNGNIK